MTDGKKRWGAEIDEETKRILDEKLDRGESAELIREFAETIAYGGDWDARTPLDMQIERVKTELNKARERRRREDAKVETLENELADLRQKRESVQTAGEQFEGALKQLEQSFRRGEIGHAFVEHPRIQMLADDYDRDAQAVYDDLVDRNPDVPDRAFAPPIGWEKRGETHGTFTGLPDDQATTPVDERGDEVAR